MSLGLITTLSLGAAPGWRVLQDQFSAISIGLAFKDTQTGWTTFTDGASAPEIVKTVNGGKNWSKVNSSSPVVIATGFASKPGSDDVVGLFAPLMTQYSLDGDNFQRSRKAPPVSQSIKFQANRFVAAGADGPCFSLTGADFICNSTVPLKSPGTGRYVSSPSANVIYFTAGQWPSQELPEGARELSRNMKMVRHGLHGHTLLHDTVVERRASKGGVPNDEAYTAELWKSVDGGKTWTSLIDSSGEFYFNDVDCADETTCVAVGEGFGQDGSPSPGARVYVTTDGKTFALKHQEADGSSLMAAKAISATEHWAGGSAQAGGLRAPLLALHSTDGGESWANEHNGVTGQMITSFAWPTPSHAFATTVNALQISSLLEYA